MKPHACVLLYDSLGNDVISRGVTSYAAQIQTHKLLLNFLMFLPFFFHLISSC